MIHTLSKARSLIGVLILFPLFIACDPLEDLTHPQFKEGRVQVLYEGITTTGGGERAEFSLINDSTTTVEYFAYSVDQPHYSTEMLSDTGWVYLFWNWCGTGASNLELPADSSQTFYASLPYESCTWRMMISIWDPGAESGYILYSEPIIYTKESL